LTRLSWRTICKLRHQLRRSLSLNDFTPANGGPSHVSPAGLVRSPRPDRLEGSPASPRE
jgi:hypothetical protein